MGTIASSRKWIYIVFFLLAAGSGFDIHGGEKVSGSHKGNQSIDPDQVGGSSPAVNDPMLLGLDYTKEGAGNVIKLKWNLSKACEFIVVCRGAKPLAVLPGHTEEFTYEEEQFGLFRYTVALFHHGTYVDEDDVLVDIGTIGWDPPVGPVSGYYLYLAEAIGDPYTALPYDNPYDYTLDMTIYSKIWLLALYDLGLLEDGKKYYVATSSYVTGCPDIVVSSLTDPAMFEYHVVTAKPTP
ncbi:MAG: hypothetical protein ACYTG7_11205 [Planctomycetota bacterium]|jgi:hypothetical protein